ANPARPRGAGSPGPTPAAPPGTACGRNRRLEARPPAATRVPGGARSCPGRLLLRFRLHADAEPLLGARDLADLGVERDPQLSARRDHPLHREIERNVQRVELERVFRDRGHVDGTPEHDRDLELGDRFLDSREGFFREERFATAAENAFEQTGLEDLDPVERDLHVEEVGLGIDRHCAKTAMDPEANLAIGGRAPIRISLDHDDAELVPQGNGCVLEMNDDALADRLFDGELRPEETADDGLADSDEEPVARHEGAALLYLDQLADALTLPLEEGLLRKVVELVIRRCAPGYERRPRHEPDQPGSRHGGM